MVDWAELECSARRYLLVVEKETVDSNGMDNLARDHSLAALRKVIDLAERLAHRNSLLAGRKLNSLTGPARPPAQ